MYTVGGLLSCGKRAGRPVAQGRCVEFSSLRRGREDGHDAFDVVLTFSFERSWFVVADFDLSEFGMHRHDMWVLPSLPEVRY